MKSRIWTIGNFKKMDENLNAALSLPESKYVLCPRNTRNSRQIYPVSKLLTGILVRLNLIYSVQEQRSGGLQSFSGPRQGCMLDITQYLVSSINDLMLISEVANSGDRSNPERNRKTRRQVDHIIASHHTSPIASSEGDNPVGGKSSILLGGPKIFALQSSTTGSSLVVPGRQPIECSLNVTSPWPFSIR